jgi:hypothetical protein
VAHKSSFTDEHVNSKSLDDPDVFKRFRSDGVRQESFEEPW